MAEWIGHMMAQWPTWAVVIGIAAIAIVALIYYLADATLIGGTEPYWRRKHGKK